MAARVVLFCGRYVVDGHELCDHDHAFDLIIFFIVAVLG